jgi:hypothetical protein
MAAAPPPIQAAAGGFALFPGTVANVPLDMTSAADVKLYYKAIDGLKSPYNLSPIGLNQFLDSVGERVASYGWSDVINVNDSGNPPVVRNLLSEYGMLSIQDCRTAAMTYFNQQTRQAQNSVMLYQFLSSSLTEEARVEVFAFSKEFKLHFPAPSTEQVGVGVLLLKTLIGKAVVDTDATIYTLRNSIGCLDHKIVELQSNIKLFNLYVVQQKSGLIARGEDTPELVMNLFKAYACVSDETFVHYIESKQFAHFDRTEIVTAESLMARALAQYEYCIDSGTWHSAPSKKDAKIIALAAEAKQKARKDRKAASTDKRNSQKYAWKKIKPEGNETTKVVGSNTYNWCKWHQAWVIHSPADCDLQHKPKSESNAKSSEGLKMDPALQAVDDDAADSDNGDSQS